MDLTKLLTVLLGTLLLLLSLSNGQLTAKLYLNEPAGRRPEQQPSQPPSLSTSELNAILSHKLNISQFENLPPSLHPTTPKAQLVLGNTYSNLPLSAGSPSGSGNRKLFIALYGNDGETVLPADFIARSQMFGVPNPPETLSFDALISVYIGRIVESMRLPIDSIPGLKDFIQAYHDGMGLQLAQNLDDWAADWPDSLSDWKRWAADLSKPISSNSPLSVEPDLEKFTLAIKEYGTLDSPAYQILDDLKQLDEFVQKRAMAPPIAFLRLSGLQEVRRRHGESSIQYRTSVRAIQELLGEVLKEGEDEGMETIVIGIPGQLVHARLGKRTELSILSPFKTSEQSFIRRELIDRRRSIFGSQAIPIIPSSRKCFPTKAECLSASSDCNGHGQCVQGQKTSGGKCFVCACQKSSDVKTGKVTYWAGDSCQKQDISSGFVLLAGSAFLLIIFFALAVRLLASVGSENLPQQLASISGHSKKID
ncbi:uncharacterized protein PGTG_08395 [Puccinia graminis f. sp. tritici CRL 75-36-700-3]|uniref:Vacuolar sorting protein Vps3844 C-terminal domain-containing protein n=1 Tax=Puccinia graminis f. sp. tritici (strain CRL 75-36-700-3 / race SCCL) TaxID=418459 RepID=E3KDK3_PUCGT|nr:uncharacterized protein PGTG_08395 [Puccinia graminis f. sp. tritici CRL 75-36-700-3]EFP82439.1 hypothetical protein PGTG_08395 [Puccinia graminis f. sp. tritici CRL 75-36-700-3]